MLEKIITPNGLKSSKVRFQAINKKEYLTVLGFQAKHDLLARFQRACGQDRIFHNYSLCLASKPSKTYLHVSNVRVGKTGFFITT
jgi:hypothetical protein